MCRVLQREHLKIDWSGLFLWWLHLLTAIFVLKGDVKLQLTPDGYRSKQKLLALER